MDNPSYDMAMAELEGLRRDAEWRRRWHARLGRGNLTEGRFYEIIEPLLRCLQDPLKKDAPGGA